MKKNKIIGIYKITNPNNKIYIGQSRDVLSRIKYYKGIHCKGQPKLYSSLKKYGWDRHAFKIICQCEESNLNKLEIHYANLFNVYDKDYGLNLIGCGNSKGYHSEETKNRISVVRRTKGSYFVSIKTRIKLSESHKGLPSGMKGKKHTKEANEKNRLAHLGISPPNKGLFGNKLSKDAILKRTETRRKNGWNKNPELRKERIRESFKKLGIIKPKIPAFEKNNVMEFHAKILP
jgi:group I intron endonuclease